MNTILDLGTKHIRVLSKDKHGIHTMGLALDMDDSFDLNSYLKSCEKALQSKKLSFLKNTIVDCLLPSSFFNYKVECLDQAGPNTQIDKKSQKHFNFEIDLSLDLRNRINKLFSYSQIEIDYLGSSLTCDLQEIIDLSKQDSDLKLFVNFSHSSLNLAIIRQGVVLDFFQNSSLCSKNFDGFLLNDLDKPFQIEDDNSYFIFLPSIHIAQKKVKAFQQVSPFLKKLLNNLHEVIHTQETLHKQVIQEVHLSGGGFQFKYFPQFVEQMLQRRVVSFDNDLNDKDKNLLYSPLFHFQKRRENGLA
ncbi:MAG: hypothetical protein KC646_13750 [Candidatus Cloacimonetes bacterium]|nr:hypothetical protein [Candidatus Cloacimonadota bacterium]